MDLRQLTYFVEIVRRGGFTRAAEAIHVAQPALSAAIRKLEAELGVTLLERGARRVALTADGRAFLTRAEAILGGVRGLELEMRERQGLLRGELAVAIPAMLATYALPAVVESFRARHPGIVLAEIERRGRTPRIAFESDLVALLVAATAGGGGVTTLLRLAAEAEPRLVPLSLRPGAFVEAGFAWRAGAYLSKAARAFVDFVLAADLPGVVRRGRGA
jgi:DNA-binding transcriptional LysR family regulator